MLGYKQRTRAQKGFSITLFSDFIPQPSNFLDISGQKRKIEPRRPKPVIKEPKWTNTEDSGSLKDGDPLESMIQEVCSSSSSEKHGKVVIAIAEVHHQEQVDETETRQKKTVPQKIGRKSHQENMPAIEI